jgi:DNA polymerase III subunit gamma/tau
MAWYNKYRPQRFSDVTGQSLVKSVLQNALEKDRVKHAYLFYGPKGVGKTTLARIFAANLNNLEQNPEAIIDTIEMDAASNTSIDDIRQLIESAKTPPLIGKYKIYIIDEVHMLSKAAMNALLKILEEPPLYLVFLMATTNPEKLIPTVLSRLTKLNLNSHSQQDIIDNLQSIAALENLNIDENSLKLIAKRSSGSLRDGVNLLETIASYELDHYSVTDTNQLLGLLPIETLQNLARALLSGGAIQPETIFELEASGIDGETFLGQFLEFLLTTSFEGDKSNDSLIIPVAEILNLKLPITSITSSIALTQVKLGVTSNTPETTTLKKNSEPGTDSIIKVVEAKPQMIESTRVIEQKTPLVADQSQNKIQIDSQIHLVEMPTFADKAELLSGDSSSPLSIEKMETILGGLTQLTEAPPILKMMISDLSVQSVTTENVELGISNAIFQTQLSSPKLNKWLVDQFCLKLGLKNIKISVTVRESNKPVKKIEATILAPKTIQDKQSLQTAENPNLHTTNTAETKLPEKLSKYSEGIFYEVYNQLPPGADPSKLKVFPAPLPMPKITQNWDDHAGELFDFED